MPVPLLANFLRLAAKELVQSLVQDATAEVQKLDLSVSVQLDLTKFDHLKKNIKRAVIIGCNRAAKPVRAAVIANAQGISRHGFLAKSIGTKTRFYPSKAIVTVIGPKMSFARTKGKFARGPRAGQTRRHVPYLYSWLLEKGTKRSAAKPFLKPAWDTEGPGYLRRVAAEIEAEVAKLLG